MWPLVADFDVRAVLPTVHVPTLVVHHSDDPLIPPAVGRDVADHIEGAKYVELPGRNVYHFVQPWRSSFQEIAEFLTGQQTEVPDDRVLATVLFTDIVDSRDGPPRSGTATGMRYSTCTTPLCGHNSHASAAGR